jgi:hypothetical protein
MTTAAVLQFGRPSLAETGRVDTWMRLLEAAGTTPRAITLVPGGRPRRPRLTVAATRAVIGAHAVPEALGWSAHEVLDALDLLQPGLVVCVTARTYQPALVSSRWVVALDFVDRLSESYRQRAAITRDRRAAVGYRLLERTWRRFEGQPLPAAVQRVAVGWRDASALGAQWLPNLISDAGMTPARQVRPVHDLVFFGTLDYLPNVEGLERLARILTLVPNGRRPTVLVAGRNPSCRVRDLVRTEGWTLQEGYATVQELAERASLAVAPMASVAGMQNKVLEAAAVGLSQVASCEAMTGFRPGFPVPTAATDADFARRITELLDDPCARATQAAAARAEVASAYTVPSWIEWARSLTLPHAERTALRRS